MEDMAAKVKDVLVKEIMTIDVPVTPPDVAVFRAGSQMIVHRLAQMPVVENDKLVGMIGQSKIFASMMQQVVTKEQKAAKKVPAAKATKKPTEPKEKYTGRERRQYERVRVKLTVAYKITDVAEAAGSEAEGKFAKYYMKVALKRA